MIVACCKSPVPATRKLLAELSSNDRKSPKHALAIETGTDELGTLTHVDCGSVVETGGERLADPSAAYSAWTVWVINEAKAREIPPSPPETTAWDVIGGKALSDVPVCEVKV